MRATNHKLANRAHAIRVERVSDAYEAPEDARLVGQLEKSVEMARASRSDNGQALSPREITHTNPDRVRNGSGTGQAAPAPMLEAKQSQVTTQPLNHSAETHPITPLTAKFLAAYCIAVDVLAEARIYAQRKGLPIDFRGEDVRALAATLVIDQQRGGR